MPYASKIANALLYNPFDNKAIMTGNVMKEMTPDVFFNECYTMPLFMNKSIDQRLWMESGQKTDNFEYEIKLHDFLNFVLRREDDFRNFLMWTQDFRTDAHNDAVYTISGNAGTGKTTFVNYLRHSMTDINWIILDLSVASEYTYWLKHEHSRVAHFEYAFGKIFSIITEVICEKIFHIGYNAGVLSINAIYENLLKITNNYKDKFLDSIMSSCEFLENICAIVDNCDSKRKCILDTSSYCANYFSELSSNCVANGDISTILEILMYILRCSQDDSQKRYVIVFDNIERFIQQDEIFNDDVNKFRLSLNSFAYAMNRPLSPHKGYFKFIMVVRTSTARMMHIRQHSADVLAYDMNIDEFYDTADIINKKFNWYLKSSLLSEQFSDMAIKATENEYDLVHQIINDFRKTNNGNLTGLKIEINSLFNNNNRLIVDFIGSMVESSLYTAYFIKYLELWREDTASSRFAARSIVRGLLLDSLERQDNLFMHLKEYDPSVNGIGVGDARKLLTILYNDSDESSNQGMKLSKVLSKLYDVVDVEAVWKSDDINYRQKREEIASTLFYMNSYNRRDNNWIQFVDLRINRQAKSSILISNPDELENLISTQMNRIALYLMPAGKAYLNYIVASFEFFSMKANKPYIPLFTLIPSLDEISLAKSVEDFRCYQVIKKTSAYTLRNLEILRFEDDIPICVGKKWLYHSERIKNAHSNYLSCFCQYIEQHFAGQSLTEIHKSKLNNLISEILFVKAHYN